MITFSQKNINILTPLLFIYILNLYIIFKKIMNINLLLKNLRNKKKAISEVEIASFHERQ
jgi:hypothetical protein